MIKKLKIDDYRCNGAVYEGATTVTYLIYPDPGPFNDEWFQEMSEQLEVSLVAVNIPADKWNSNLSPWPEPGETTGYPPFAGEAKEFLLILLNKIIPEVEKELELGSNLQRDLMGVSLGGLFTFWQWMDCDEFHNIACLSGSFWYTGFINWFENRKIPSKTGKAFFLLGEDEPLSHLKAFDSVGKNTEAIVEKLKDSGIKVELKWVPGNHFSHPLHRAELALNSLYNSH